jgi:hypothetical protein
MTMKSIRSLHRTLVVAAAIAISGTAVAQQSEEFRSGYAQGYREGFDAGYAKAAAGAPQPVVVPARGFPIAITAATYGPEDSRERCDATHHVRREANGRRSASVDISNSMCGDPAPGKRKLVEISYLCGNVAKTATAYEHRSAYLSCD